MGKETTNDILAQAWEDREGYAILATVDANKKPNIIYVGEVHYVPGEGIIVADNYFHKTRVNIQNGTEGAFLFLTKDRKAYQVKGPLSYHTQGPIFEKMRAEHDPKRPGVAAALLQIKEVYSGAERLL
jgi:predicted pyridoxine 5'-phosphate oxidase superfamily flavin-nucleotide-binding protein